jgi:hypothetical protein
VGRLGGGQGLLVQVLSPYHLTPHAVHFHVRENALRQELVHATHLSGSKHVLVQTTQKVGFIVGIHELEGHAFRHEGRW